MDSEKVGRGEVQKRGSGSAGALFLGALMGVMAGAAVGVLMAPQSGEATKEEIRTRGESLRTNAEMRLHEGRSQAEQGLNKARHALAEWLEQGSQMLDRQAKDLRA